MMNVAVTRSKEEFYIIGDKKIILIWAVMLLEIHIVY